MNVQRKENFTQVAVWRGTVVGPEMVADFESFFDEEMSVRVQYLEEIKTYPDLLCGIPVEGTGGRNDVFFAIHKDDVGKFAGPRLGLDGGCSWVEDVIANSAEIYPDRIREYKSW